MPYTLGPHGAWVEVTDPIKLLDIPDAEVCWAETPEELLAEKRPDLVSLPGIVQYRIGNYRRRHDEESLPCVEILPQAQASDTATPEQIMHAARVLGKVAVPYHKAVKWVKKQPGFAQSRKLRGQSTRSGAFGDGFFWSGNLILHGDAVNNNNLRYVDQRRPSKGIPEYEVRWAAQKIRDEAMRVVPFLKSLSARVTSRSPVEFCARVSMQYVDLHKRLCGNQKLMDEHKEFIRFLEEYEDQLPVLQEVGKHSARWVRWMRATLKRSRTKK